MINKKISSCEDQKNFEKSPFNIMVEKAEGLYLFDEHGKQYLDLTSNDDHNPFGFSTELKNNFVDCGFIKSRKTVLLEEEIKNKIGFEKTFCFSEKQHAYSFLENIINLQNKNSVLISSQKGKNEFITDKDVINIYLNDYSHLKTFLNKSTAAVIVELAQFAEKTEVADEDYLKELKDHCNKNGALLVYDECAISPLRLKKGLLNFDESIKSDILIASKGWSAGIPFYMVCCDEKILSENISMPETKISSAACETALDFLGKYAEYEKLIEENSKYLEEKFDEMSEKHVALADVISYGMMYALVTEIPSDQLTKELFENGYIVKPLNKNAVMIKPPYNIGKKEIDGFMQTLDMLFDRLAAHDRLI